MPHRGIPLAKLYASVKESTEILCRQRGGFHRIGKVRVIIERELRQDSCPSKPGLELTPSGIAPGNYALQTPLVASRIIIDVQAEAL